MTAAEVRQVLTEVVDPELGVNIVDLGLVCAIDVAPQQVRITMTMTSPACPLRDYLQDLVESAIRSHFPDVREVVIDVVDDPPWTADRMSETARRQLE